MKKTILMAGALLLARSAAASAPWVAAYYAGWEQSHLPIASVDMTAFDALIHFAVVPNADGTLNSGVNGLGAANVASVVAAVHAAGKKALFTVGGAGSQAAFESAMSPSNLSVFVNNIAAFMTSNGYDGVDIDMEEMSAADVAPYVAFARALRARMTAVRPGSLLTAAVTWEPSAFAQLNGVFDHVDLMTYSLAGGTWFNETWHDAAVYSAPAQGGGTLPSADSMVKQFEAAGVPAASLGIGITFDPYVWTGGSGVTAPQQGWTGAPAVTESEYYTIADSYGLTEGSQTGPYYHWDAAAQASYLSVPGTPASADAFVTFDDAYAIAAKFAYARAHGLGSVIVWDLAGGWRPSRPAGQQGLLLAAVKSAAYGAAPAPVVSAVSAQYVGASSATVSWTTDQASDSQVLYGTAAAYGSATALSSPRVKTHSAELTGLTPGALYHYSVESRAASGVLTSSGDFTFSAQTTPPTVTLGSPPTGTTIGGVVSVTASASSSLGLGGVQFKLDGEDLGAPMTSGPYAFMWNTSAVPDGRHGLAAVAWDADGNASTSAVSIVTIDNAPPVIGGVAAAVGVSSAAISWTTDHAASSSVQFGTTAAYGSALSTAPALLMSHLAALSGLAPGTLYHYAVQSQTAFGALSVSADFTFTTSSPTAPSSLVDEFNSYPFGACIPDGSTFGPWTQAFAGYGCVETGALGAASWLEEKPSVSTAPALTHAALVLGPSFAAPLAYSVNVNTVAQLRTGSAPNPWEVGWVVWDYVDDSHFYYFQAKPNGWELGKEDPAYPGAQRFLATGSSPQFPIGSANAVRIAQNAPGAFSVYVNNQLIVSFTDVLSPYSAGRVGLYDEDADVRFENVAVNVPSSSPPAPITDSPGVAPTAGLLAKAPQRFLTPATADGINDSAVFGSAAQEVSVYNLRGRLVFHGSQQGGTAIVWNCKDAAGRVDETGVYIARIRTADAGTLYQSFALVK
jgi:chitinase